MAPVRGGPALASAPAAAPVPLFEAGPYMSLVPQFDAKTTRMADPKRAWMEVNGITGRHEPLSKLYGAVGAAGSKPVPPQVFVRPGTRPLLLLALQLVRATVCARCS